MENTTTNAFILGLIESAVQHLTLRVIEQMGVAIDARINAKLDEALHDTNHAIVALKVGMDKLGKFTDSDEFTGLVRQLVSDYLDDNRWMSKTDEALDNIVGRLDELEDETGSGMSRKLKAEVENVVQDKFDESKFITKDDLGSEVAEVISSGSFSFNRY
jgi:hypothetical protein